MVRSGAHEVGHGLGLRHPKSQNEHKDAINFGKENLMHGGADGKQLLNVQRNTMENITPLILDDRSSKNQY